MDDQSWSILVVVLGILVAVMYQKHTKLQAAYDTLDGSTIQKNLKIKDKYIDDLENEIDGYRSEIEEIKTEANSWRGKANQKGTLPRYKASKYDLEKNSDIKALVSNLLEDASKTFGPDVAEILKDPAIRDKITNYAAENPEQAKQFLSRFIGGSSNQEQSTIIPNFDKRGAI
jgi:hypothetical protein